jgi:hypothetical protein
VGSRVGAVIKSYSHRWLHSSPVTARRAVGQSGSRAVGQSGSRAVGQSGSRAVGQSGSRAVGQSGSRADCMSMHRRLWGKDPLLPRLGTSGSSRVRQAGPLRAPEPSLQAARRGVADARGVWGIRPDAQHGAWSGRRGNPHAYPPLDSVFRAGTVSARWRPKRSFCSRIPPKRTVSSLGRDAPHSSRGCHV